MTTNLTIKDLVINTLNEQKALNVLSISLKGKTDIADYIIIATGTSNRHLHTLSEKISRVAKSNKIKVLGIDGEETGDWIVIDLQDVIVHLFREEVREYYQIEKIWE